MAKKEIDSIPNYWFRDYYYWLYANDWWWL